MPINTKDDYIEIGTSYNSDYSFNDLLKLPAPIELPFADEFLADASRNANGTMIFQQLGRTQYTTKIKWGKLENKFVWKLNRWFEKNGYAFYIKYFNHSDGRVKIHRFYRGTPEQATPSAEREDRQGYSVPKYYKGVGFSLIDMGEDDVIIVEEMGL